MFQNSELIYTSFFKLYNLDISSESIQLSDTAWIEKSEDFVDTPHNFPYTLLYGAVEDQDPISKFFSKLLKSPVCIRTTHTAEEAEHNPFGIHDCTYIAIALSILCESWFFVGIESFYNNKDLIPSLSPYSNYFLGNKGSTDCPTVCCQ